MSDTLEQGCPAGGLYAAHEGRCAGDSYLADVPPIASAAAAPGNGAVEHTVLVKPMVRCSAVRELRWGLPTCMGAKGEAVQQLPIHSAGE